MAETQQQGYEYASKTYGVGERLPILEHSGCSGEMGEVVLLHKKSGQGQFVLACLKCLKQGMIPQKIEASHPAHRGQFD